MKKLLACVFLLILSMISAQAIEKNDLWMMPGCMYAIQKAT